MRFSSILRFIPAVSIGVAAGGSGAQVMTYGEPQLCARAAHKGAFRLPDQGIISSANPVINTGGQVAFRVGLPENHRVLWVGTPAGGGVVEATRFQGVIGDIGLNDDGRLVWAQSDSQADGLYAYAPAGKMAGLIEGVPRGPTNYGSPRINTLNQVAYRTTTGQDAFKFESVDSGPPKPSVAVHAENVVSNPKSPFSYLFTPSFNDQRQVASKVRLGAAKQVDDRQPDQIRLFNADGSSRVVASDADANPNSRYAGFDNSVALDNAGQVAFAATLKGGKQRGLFLVNAAGQHVPIAVEGKDVAAVDVFPPAVNLSGLVAFRGKELAQQKPALFVGAGAGVQRVVGVGDTLKTENGGKAVVAGFSGAPSLNEFGDLAFAVSLEGGSTGVYVVAAPRGQAGGGPAVPR